METPRNGSPVTWRELELALQPLRTQATDLDRKVDQILDQLAENRGESRARRTFLDSSRFWITTATLAMTSSFAATVTAIFLRKH